MPKFLFFTFFLLSSILLAQTKITVMDGFMEDQPMEDVYIINQDNVELGKTNSKGIFIVPAGTNLIRLHYDGYEERKLYVYGKDLVVQLKPITVQLSSSEISNDDSEARNIIKQVIQNQKKNSIENLKTYEYKSYTKFLVTASTDSMPYILMPKNESDSSYNDVRRLLDKSHLMLGERAMDHKFSSQYGNKNIVKATRVSGTKIPLYEFVAMQPISHTFTDDKIDFFFRSFVNPVSISGLNEYRFRISDKDVLEGKEMIVISFFPQKRLSNKQQIKGKVWIDQKTKALAKFYAENLSDTSIAELEMDFTNYQNFWFPLQQRYRMDGGAISYPAAKDTILSDGTLRIDTIKKKEKVWLHLTTSFKDILSPVEFQRNEFKGYTNEIDLRSIDNSDLTLEAYRDSILTEMEKNTYVAIDSIGQKYNMDRNIRLLRILSSGGKYSIGNYDLDLTKFFHYNDYEGFRLGIGGGTNYKFNENIYLNGYVAYGFKDEAFKFGGGIDWLVNKPYSGKIFANYAQDVEASGRNPILLQNNYIQYLNDNFTNIYNDFFYSYRNVSLGYQQDFLQNFSIRIAGIYNEKEAEFPYQYQDNRLDEKYLSFDTQVALRWAPKDQNVRTPYGKVTISSGMPVFYLALTQGINVFNADYTPTKVDFTYLDLFRTFVGQTNFQFRAGASFGDTPIFNLYEGMGNAKGKDKIFKNFGVAGLNNFETMKPGEFYSDRYLMFHMGHKFAGFKLFNQEIFPEFIYRGLWGTMENMEDHQLVSFDTPKNYYQEAGVEFNQLIYGLFGVGAYYRFGSYAHENFDQNFYLKATLKLTFF
jgi:hypothetical protein